jgi:hypothetical protein
LPFSTLLAIEPLSLFFGLTINAAGGEPVMANSSGFSLAKSEMVQHNQ